MKDENNVSRAEEKKAWFAVAAWAMLILVSIPVARGLRDWVAERWSSALFGYAALAGVLLMAAWGAGAIWRARRRFSWSSGAWLAVVAAVSIGWISSLWRNPEEALHIVEYGILGLLFANGLRHRVGDATVFVIAALLTTCFGIVDELIQWANPTRYFDFRDIWLNAGASSLALIGMWKGVSGQRIEPISARAVRRLCFFAAATLLLILLLLSLTPSRVEAVVRAIPALSFLTDPRDAVAEYGHRHELEGVGHFTSRFTMDELARRDRDEAAAAAVIILEGKKNQKLFFSGTSRAQHGFARETGARIFIRGSRIRRAQDTDAGSSARRLHATEALAEQRILEAFYSRTTTQAKAEMGSKTRHELEQWAEPFEGWTSMIDRHLITFANEAQLRWTLGLVIVVLLVVGRIVGRRNAAA
jgi:hypothetical protein